MQKVITEQLDQIVGGRRNSVSGARRWSRGSSSGGTTTGRPGRNSCSGGRRK